MSRVASECRPVIGRCVDSREQLLPKTQTNTVFRRAADSDTAAKYEKWPENMLKLCGANVPVLGGVSRLSELMATDWYQQTEENMSRSGKTIKSGYHNTNGIT